MSPITSFRDLPQLFYSSVQNMLRTTLPPSKSQTSDSSTSESGSNKLAGLKIAQLRTVDLKGLEQGDKTQKEELFLACKTDGFFYLDLRGYEQTINPIVDSIYRLTKELYDLPLEEKNKYDVDKLSRMKLNGYKPVGRNYGGIGGRKDGFETYVIPKDGILHLTDAPFSRPAVVDTYLSTLQQFTNAIGMASKLVMTSLSQTLSLPSGHGFEDYHRITEPTPDIVRLLKYHAQPIEERGASHTPHTDLGSLTFLFTKQPGLQVLEPGSKEWAWVEPREGHAIVNLGDGMSLLTNKFFHSCLHRVGPLPGQAMEERYSFAYLQRAEARTPMTGLDSDLIPKADPNVEVMTSETWLLKKFGILRLDTRLENHDWVLTGRKEAVPV